METLDSVIDRLTAKSQDITDFCNIVCNEDLKADILALETEVFAINSLLKQTKQVLKDHPATMREMQAALYELRRQETIMLLALDKTGSPIRSEEPQMDYLTPTRPIRNAVPQSSVKKIQWDKRTTSYQPPPPSTGKKKSGQVLVDHFAYSISEKEFNSIPKYLRAGREQLPDLQRCIDEVICPCLLDKYSLLSKATNELANVNQRQLQRMFRDQESYFPGHFFITEGDIARFTESLIDKKLRNRILMLRQLGLIKEVRKNSTACYMWMIRVEQE